MILVGKTDLAFYNARNVWIQTSQLSQDGDFLFVQWMKTMDFFY